MSLSELLERWRIEEDRLEVEIDARIFSYLASTDEGFHAQLSEIRRKWAGATATPTGSGSIRSVYGVWPRGSGIRERALEAYNPYAPLPKSDPLLLLTELQREIGVPGRGESGLASPRPARARGVRDRPPHGRLRSVRAAAPGHPGPGAPADGDRLPAPRAYVARVDQTGQVPAVTLHLREAVQ